MDVDLRKLRYFVAVAEHAGFRRAADALHIAQPALTRQIQSLEGEMNAELFTRSFRGTELTEAGKQLLEDAQPLLEYAGMLRTRLAEAAVHVRHLTIGFGQGISVAPIVREFSALYPMVKVDLASVEPQDQAAGLLTGRIDLCFAREPINADGVVVCPLFQESRVVAMPSDSPLSRLEYLEIKDLTGFRLLQDPRQVPELARHPEVRLGAPEPVQELTARETAEIVERVAAQHGIVILPESVASLYTRPDVAYCPVNGLAPSNVVIAYAHEHDSREVSALLDIAVQMFEARVAA